VLGIRPEAFDDAAFSRTDLPRIDVTADVLEELGADSHVFFRVAAPRVTFETRGEEDDETTILAEHDSRFTARVDPASTARVGEPLTLTVDPSKFHFFDVRGGESLLADARREPAHEEALPG
jgi:ABC-type sugar transport system ATPase subunit